VNIRSATAGSRELATIDRRDDLPLVDEGSHVGGEERVASSPPRVEARRLSLRANFAWTLAGNICNAACTWLIVVAIVKLGSMEMAGYYAFAQAIVLPILSFSTLQLRGIYATDATGQYRFGHYLGLRTVTTCVALAVVTAIAFGWSNRRDMQWLTLAIGLGAAIDAMSDIIYGSLQQRERMQWIAASMIARSLLGLAALIAILAAGGSLVEGMFASAAARVLILVALDVPLGAGTLAMDSPGTSRRARFREVLIQSRDLDVLRKLAWISLPLGPTTMLMTLQATLPRYLIEHWLNARQLGLFAALSYLSAAGAIVATALAQSAAPRMSQHYLAGDSVNYRRLLARLAALGGGFGAVGVLAAALWGKPLLSMLYKPEYAERNDIFVWLMVAAGLTYISIFLGWGMTAARRLRIQLPLFGTIVASMLVAGCLLVPRFGLTGAALTVVIGSVVQAAGCLLVVVAAVRVTASSRNNGVFEGGAQS